MQGSSGLSEANYFYKDLFEQMDQAYFLLEVLFDTNGGVTDIYYIELNPAAERLIGSSCAGKLASEINVHYPDYVLRLFERVARTGVADSCQFCSNPQGIYYQILAHKTGLAEERKIAVIYQEVSIPKNLIRDEGEGLLRANIDSSLDMIQAFQAVRDDTGEIVDFIWILNNATSEKIYGDVIGKSLLTLNPGVMKEGIFDTFKKVVETGIPDKRERHYVHEQFNGWFYQSAVKMGDGVATTTSDISEMKKAARELQQSKILLQDIIDAPNIGIAVYKAVRDDHGKIVDFVHEYINRATADMLGEDVTGKMLSHHGENGNTQLQFFTEVIETGQDNSYIKEVIFRDREAWFSITNTPLNDDRLVHTWEDITARKKAERDAALTEAELQNTVRQIEARRKQELFRAVLSAQEEERQRISEGLHNDLAQLLYAVKLNVSNLTETQLAQYPEKYRKQRYETEELLTQAIKRTRYLSHELIPFILRDYGLQTSIEDICRHFDGAVRITCNFNGLGIRFEHYLELAVYRMVQELTLNIVKHADATEAHIELEVINKIITITVADNGKGFDRELAPPGLGLVSIKNKVELLEGNFEIISKAGNGSTVRIQIPINENRKDV